MTKHKSEGLKNKLKETKLKNKERFEYLKNKEHKIRAEYQEFYFLKDNMFSTHKGEK